MRLQIYLLFLLLIISSTIYCSEFNEMPIYTKDALDSIVNIRNLPDSKTIHLIYLERERFAYYYNSSQYLFHCEKGGWEDDKLTKLQMRDSLATFFTFDSTGNFMFQEYVKYERISNSLGNSAIALILAGGIVAILESVGGLGFVDQKLIGLKAAAVSGGVGIISFAVYKPFYIKKRDKFKKAFDYRNRYYLNLQKN